MKRLNRKGFTLVELLAVIVILAIVVGITLVTVLPTLKKSRQEAFNLTAQTVADYLEKQYQLTLVGEPTTLENNKLPGGTLETISSTNLKAAGVKPENYNKAEWYINSTTGRACVQLTAATTAAPNSTTKKAGEYYDVTDVLAKSTGC